MAETIFRRLIVGYGLGWRAASAGIAAVDGAAAAAPAVEVMHEQGLDLSDHNARLLTRELVNEADVIFTMTDAHKAAVASAYPHVAGKTFTLKGFVGEAGDVDDPVGQGVGTYRQTAEQLRSLLEKLVDQLLERPPWT